MKNRSILYHLGFNLCTMNKVRKLIFIAFWSPLAFYAKDLIWILLATVKALNQARLEANIRVYGDEKHQKRWPSPYAVASGVLLLLSILKFVYHPLQYLALGAVAAGAFPIILKAVVSIRNLRLDINILVIIAGNKLHFPIKAYYFWW